MQHRGPVLSAIGVLLLVLVIGLVGGCHGGAAENTPGYATIGGLWWLTPVPAGYEHINILIDAEKWVLTKKKCGYPPTVIQGTWLYNETTRVYTFKEDGGPTFEGQVDGGLFADDLGHIYTKTKTTQPCP